MTIYCVFVQQRNPFIQQMKNVIHIRQNKLKVANFQANSQSYSSAAKSRRFSLLDRCNFLITPQRRFLYTKPMNFSMRNASSPVSRQRSDLQRLFELAKPERFKLFGAVCLLFVSSAVTMAVPFSLGKVLDIIYNNSSEVESTRSKLNSLCGVLVCVFCFGALCNFGRVYVISTTGYRITQQLRVDVFKSILRQEQGFFDMRATGELVNRLSADSQIVGQALTSNISDGLRSMVMVCAGSGMMFYMSPELALVGLAIVPPIAGAAVVYGRFVRNITRNVQDSLANVSSLAEERIGNIRTVKTFAQEKREVDSYTTRIADILKLGYTESKARALFYGLTGLSGNVIIISVLYYGGVMVSSDAITIGDLSSFLLYAAYIGVSVGGLSSFYSEWNKSVGAASRLWEITDREPMIPTNIRYTPIVPPSGRIEFKDISFSYPSRFNTPILHNFSLSIEPGKTLAVVGQSGSGKSTVASLLLRLYDPDAGTILIDNMDIKHVDPVWIRKNIGTVSQEPVLFSGSIRDNILYGMEAESLVDEEQFMSVVSEANVQEFVELLPNKFDTLVGERGVMLSGGQKQRVAIARALIKNPRILLLDEATSALDAHSEHLIREALERVMKGRTVLTIAHRLSTIQNADCIAVIQNGVVVEKGTYANLSTLDGGVFRELIKHQKTDDSGHRTAQMKSWTASLQ